MELEELENIHPYVKENRYVYNGISVPRVTEIISKMIHEDYIVSWANGLGFKHKSYSKTLKSAADYGTFAHTSIELFLKGEPITGYSINPVEGFKKWWSIVNQTNEVKIIGQEFKLVCSWFGGTYDLLLSINDKIYLVDFKTSNHLSYKYCLQLAAYNYMLKLGNIANISGIIILQLSKTEPGFNEFFLDFSNKEDLDYFQFCEKTFLSLAYSYYHILEAEKRYKLREDK